MLGLMDDFLVAQLVNARPLPQAPSVLSMAPACLVVMALHWWSPKSLDPVLYIICI